MPPKPDEPLYPTGLLDLTSAETDEMVRLQHILGQGRFDHIQREVFIAFIAEHPPKQTPPYYPGIWRAFLEALRAAVRH
jgi:hypothetical protein